MAYMERNTNFSIEAHTRPKKGTFFWLQVYERVGTSHKGVLRISNDLAGDNRIGAKIKTPEKKKSPYFGPKFNPPPPPPNKKKIPCRISES